MTFQELGVMNPRQTRQFAYTIPIRFICPDQSDADAQAKGKVPFSRPICKMLSDLFDSTQGVRHIVRRVRAFVATGTKQGRNIGKSNRPFRGKRATSSFPQRGFLSLVPTGQNPSADRFLGTISSSRNATSFAFRYKNCYS